MTDHSFGQLSQPERGSRLVIVAVHACTMLSLQMYVGDVTLCQTALTKNTTVANSQATPSQPASRARARPRALLHLPPSRGKLHRKPGGGGNTSEEL